MAHYVVDCFFIIFAYMFYWLMEVMSLGGLCDNPLSDAFGYIALDAWPGDYDLYVKD